MKAPQPPDMPGFSDFTKRVAHDLAGLPLKTAEEHLAGARHVLWSSHFSGFSMAEAAFGASVSSEALTLATEIAAEGRGNLFRMEDVIQEIRVVLFVGAFGIRPGTMFGEAVHMAEAALFSGREGRAN